MSALVRHGSPLEAGLLLAPMGAGAMVAMPLSGKLTDAWGGRRIAFAGIPLVAAGLLVYTQVGPGTSLVLLAGAVFVIGLGHGTILPALMSTSYQGLPRTAVGSATTASSIAIRVAGAFGTALLAVVLQAEIRAHVPGAGGSVAAAAGAARGPHATGLLADAFGATLWWAVGLTVLVLVAVALIPPRPAAERPAARPDTAEPTAERPAAAEQPADAGAGTARAGAATG